MADIESCGLGVCAAPAGHEGTCEEASGWGPTNDADERDYLLTVYLPRLQAALQQAREAIANAREAVLESRRVAADNARSLLDAAEAITNGAAAVVERDDLKARISEPDPALIEAVADATSWDRHGVRYADDDAMQCMCGWDANGDYRAHIARAALAAVAAHLADQ